MCALCAIRFPRRGGKVASNSRRIAGWALGVRSQGARANSAGGRKMGSGNGSNVRTMRTRFPRGRKVVSNSRRIASGWARCAEPGCARLLRRAVESAGVPLADGVVPVWAPERLAARGVSGAGCVPGKGSRLASSSSLLRALSVRAGSLGRVMPVSRVSIMIRHTDDCSSPVFIEKERFHGGTKPPRVLCLHASRPRSGVRPTRGCSQSGRTLRARGPIGPAARQRSPLRILFKGERTYSIDS